MLWFLVLVPAVLGVCAFFVRNLRIDLGILLGAAVIHLGATIWLWTRPAFEPGGLLSVDALGLLFLSLTSVLFLMAALYTVDYLLHGTHDAQAAPERFVPCLLWFLAAMTLVTTTQHLGLLWAAVEGTTLTSAPLVYFYGRRGALEATWKYLLLCSVGIALALLGTFFLGIAASTGEGSDLTVSALQQSAPTMSRPWLKAAFVLALVGYGTKMGLAPLHTWLPDTYSQAPSPVAALLSGALINCALLAVLRFYQITIASGDAAFARTLLLLLGFVSLGVACAFMIGQTDYKRLFAYSSVENMGIIAIGVGLGGAGNYAALLHAVNHSLCKAGLFFLAGNVLRAFGTTIARDVRGALRGIPVSGGLLVVLSLAIGGVPPFGPFWSEFLIFQSALSGAQSWLGVVFIVLLAIAFLGMARVVLPMLQGESALARGHSRESRLSVVPPLVMAVGIVLLGFYVPPGLASVLRQAASRLGS